MYSINQKSCWDAGAILGGKNHQEEAKLQYPKPPPFIKPLHDTSHWETRRTPTLPDAGSNLHGRHRPTDEQISGMWYSHSHPWDKPADPPGQTDPHPTKNWIINKELKRTWNREWSALSAPEKGEGARCCSSHELSVNKACNSSWLASLSIREGRRCSSPCKLSVSRDCKSRQLASLPTGEEGRGRFPCEISVNKACNS
jgi:hypothetical protein